VTRGRIEANDIVRPFPLNRIRTLRGTAINIKLDRSSTGRWPSSEGMGPNFGSTP